MRTIKITTASVIFWVMMMAACSKNSTTSSGGGGGGGSTAVSCNGVPTSFATNVLPLIQTKCATNSSCHATGASNGGGVLTTHAQISAKAAAIKSSVVSGSMPKSGSLTAAEKAAIVCWVDAGALNN